MIKRKCSPKHLLLFLFFLVTLNFCGFSMERGGANTEDLSSVQMEVIPPKPNPAHLVNDYAGVFSMDQIRDLEQKLVAFNDTTSNQITLLTVSDLGDYDPAQFAYEVGEKWGVGNKKYNNGIVLLIKPKNETKGQVFIAPGYGLEAALPDITCKQIIENEMIPHFRENDYYGGVVQALQIIMPLASGEISSEEYANKKGGGSIAAIAALLFFVVMIIVFVVGAKKDKGNHFDGGNDSGLSPLLAAWMLSSAAGRNHSGSWGGFSGGGGGGFGGFGGGGFGGGGAGGSW
ncbi:MAG: TPM domain-containing protein [Bacteroidales bacterium]